MRMVVKKRLRRLKSRGIFLSLIIIFQNHFKAFLILSLSHDNGAVVVLQPFLYFLPPIIMKPCPLCFCKYIQDVSPSSHPPSPAHVTGDTALQCFTPPSLPPPPFPFILSVFSLWFPAPQQILGEPPPSSPLPLPPFNSSPSHFHLSSAPFLAMLWE